MMSRHVFWTRLTRHHSVYIRAQKASYFAYVLLENIRTFSLNGTVHLREEYTVSGTMDPRFMREFVVSSRHFENISISWLLLSSPLLSLMFGNILRAASIATRAALQPRTCISAICKAMRLPSWLSRSVACRSLWVLLQYTKWALHIIIYGQFLARF